MTPTNQFNNAVNPHLKQKLFVAAKHGDQNTLRTILGEHPEAANWRLGGKSVLQAAVEKKQYTSIATLLQAKADANAKSDDGLTSPLVIAARNDDTHMIVQLIHGGAKAYAVGGGDATPLMNAVRHNAAKAIAVLLAHGASHAANNDEGNPALHVATSAGRLKAAAALLAGKADINQRNAETLTPLMLAAKEKNLKAAKFLLENGADDTLKSDLRETALDMARAFAGGDRVFLDGYENLMAERLRKLTRDFLPQMAKGAGRDLEAPGRATFRKK